jgi:hypothetical protein
VRFVVCLWTDRLCRPGVKATQSSAVDIRRLTSMHLGVTRS